MVPRHGLPCDGFIQRAAGYASGQTAGEPFLSVVVFLHGSSQPRNCRSITNLPKTCQKPAFSGLLWPSLAILWLTLAQKLLELLKVLHLKLCQF